MCGFSLVLALAPAGVAFAAVDQVAYQAGIAQTTRTFSVSKTDFDRDGREDFFLVRHNPQASAGNLPTSILYRNTGAGFKAYSSAFGRTDKHHCPWADVNQDGRPDMFCAVGLGQFSKNELWIQNNDHTFTNRATAMGLTQDTHGRYRYATFINANGDQWPDIYVLRYKGSCFCGTYPGDSFPNELWINQKGKSFRKAPEFGLNKAISARKDNATCAQNVDYDKDGDEDLLACGGKKLHLYRNNSDNGFSDVTEEKGIGGVVQDARLVDTNGDGIKDLVKLETDRLTIRYGNGTSWGSVKYSLSVKAGEALAFGDMDGDSRTDIYVVGSKGPDRPDHILLNQGGGHFTNKVEPGTSGRGDDVLNIDYDQDRNADFLVTNGDRRKEGPVQLFTWRP